MNIYVGDPNIAVRRIIGYSETQRKSYEKCERLNDAISKIPEGSPERREKIEKLNFHTRQYQQLLNATEYMYELFCTVPRLSPRMAEAERCFLNGDFTGMDDALPEKEIMAETSRLKQKRSQFDKDWEQTELLLQEKSYELILKGLLHYTHLDRPEWYKDLWRSLTEALEASENWHTLYYNGWYSLLYNDLDKAEEFYTAANDECWTEDDLTDESQRLIEAKCLHQLACIKFRQDDLPAAIRNMQRVLELYTKLKDEKPAAYLPAIAETLAILGDYYTRSKAYSVALMEYEEALRIRRRLAVDDSDAYFSSVSELLDAVGAMHIMKKEYKDAVARYEESVSIERSFLIEFNKPEFKAMLAHSLSNLTTAYFMINRRDKIIPLMTEVVALRRELAVTAPETHQPELAYALCQVAVQRRKWNEKEEAYRDMTEGIALYRECAGRSPAEYLPKLGEKIEDLDGWCWNDRKYAEAIEACRERVEVYRRLTEESPDKYMPKLAETLERLAAMYHSTGDNGTSLSIYIEALETSRRLVEMNKGYSHILGILLMGLGVYYTDIFPDREKALAATREACAILQPLRRQNPEHEKAYNKATGIIRTWEQRPEM
jgi:tetratricopeptide (TPR) repeat protein